MDLDTGASKAPLPYQANSLWGTAVIVALVCAVLFFVSVGYYFFAMLKANSDTKKLRAQSIQLDTEITTANKWPVKTVETRAQELVSELKQYQKLLDGRKVWSKFIPTLSAHTLQGTSISGMSIDDKLAIKVDGVTHPITSGSEKITAYGLVARQIVAYRDVPFTPAPTTTPAASADAVAPSTTTPKSAATSSKIFNNVTLTAIGFIKNKDEAVTEPSARFSMTFTLNPEILKLPTQTATPTANPGATP